MTRLMSMVGLGLLLLMLPGAGPQRDSQATEIIARERAALDRWGRGDPDGYLELYADDVTYFDPMQEKRLDGRAALRAMLAPIRGLVHIARYDMIDPKVQRSGDLAVLTYNLISYSKPPTGPEVIAARWNSTAVFRRDSGAWRTIHVHWSFIKPDLKR